MGWSAVRLHADLCILARLGLALSRARAVHLAAQTPVGVGRTIRFVAKKLRCYVGQHKWVEKVRDRKKYAVCRDGGRERVLDKLDLPSGGFPPVG